MSNGQSMKLISAVIAATALCASGASFAASSAGTKSTAMDTQSGAATSPRGDVSGRTNGMANGSAMSPNGGSAITPNRSELPDSAFRKLDATNRGYVTPEETHGLSGFDFQKYDANHDGRLSEAEFQRAWAGYSGNR